MNGQLDFMDLIEEQFASEVKPCMGCENCRQTDLFKNYIDKDGVAHFLAFCNPTRQVITASTGSWLCKNKEYKRSVK